MGEGRRAGVWGRGGRELPGQPEAQHMSGGCGHRWLLSITQPPLGRAQTMPPYLKLAGGSQATREHGAREQGGGSAWGGASLHSQPHRPAVGPETFSCRRQSKSPSPAAPSAAGEPAGQRLVRGATEQGGPGPSARGPGAAAPHEGRSLARPHPSAPAGPGLRLHRGHPEPAQPPAPRPQHSEAPSHTDPLPDLRSLPPRTHPFPQAPARGGGL